MSLVMSALDFVWHGVMWLAFIALVLVVAVQFLEGLAAFAFGVLAAIAQVATGRR